MRIFFGCKMREINKFSVKCFLKKNKISLYLSGYTNIFFSMGIHAFTGIYRIIQSVGQNNSKIDIANHTRIWQTQGTGNVYSHIFSHS